MPPLVAAAALLTLLVLAAGAGHPSPASAAKQAERPNIVMIVTDDQTMEEMNSTVMPFTSAYFGALGTSFQNSITVSPSCCPSRASFLSGEYPHNNGVFANDPGYVGLKQRRNVLPVWMQQAGYRTGHFGKFLNHFGKVDGHATPAPGWDKWYTSINYRYYNYRVSSDGRIKHYGSRPRDYITWRITNAATKYIRKKARPGRKHPLYVQIDHFAPHAEQSETPGRCLESAQPDPLDADKFLDTPLPQESLDPDQRSYNETDISDKTDAISRRNPIGDYVRSKIQRRYRCQLAALVGVDRSVAAVRNALADAGVLDNTAIFFTSDNGFFHGEHRLPNNKGLPYEEGIRVPLLAILPPSLTGGNVPATVSQPVANIDLAPTFLDIAGGEPCNASGRCRRLDGRSLLGLLRGEGSGWPSDRHLLVEQGRVQYFCAPYRAIWSPHELLAQYPTNLTSGTCSVETEQYDMDADPMQLENLYPAGPSSPYSVRARHLEDVLQGLRRCSGIKGRDRPLRRKPFCH